MRAGASEENGSPRDHAPDAESFAADDNGLWLYRGHVYEYESLQAKLSAFLGAAEDPENAYEPVVLRLSGQELSKAVRRAAQRFLEYLTQPEAQEVLFFGKPGMLPANPEVREMFLSNIPNLSFLDGLRG